MNNKELDLGIQYLRGMAALFVVFFHLRSLLDTIIPSVKLGDLLFGQGGAGVDIFFIISGYIITLSTQSKHNASAKDFVIKRFFRIYPPFIVCLIIFLIVLASLGATFPISQIIKSSLLLHKDYTQGAPFFGYNILYPAWTLAYEVYFYAIFCLALLISHKHRVLVSSIFIVISTLSIQLYFSGSFSLKASETGGYGNGAFNLMASPMLIEFIAGMLLYKIRNVMPKGPQWRLFYLFGGVYALFAIFSGVNAGHGIDGYGLWAIILVSCCVFMEKSSPFSNIKPLFFLGEISYSIYLSHVIVINIVADRMIIKGYNGLPAFMMILSLCIVMSSILFSLIEKRSIQIGRSFIKKMA